MIDRPLPSSVEAERSFIASLIYRPDLIQKGLSICPVEAIYSQDHARVYQTMVDMASRDAAVDMVTLSENIKPDGQLVIAEYMNTATTENVDALASVIVEAYIRRKAIIECSQIMEMAAREQGIEKILLTLESLNARLADDIDKAKLSNSNIARIITVDDLLPEAEKYFDHGETSLSWEPGWANLANHYRPAKGTLNVYTGIPSHGKSEFVDALMVNMAVMHDWVWLIFSPENYPYYYHLQKLSEKIISKGYFAQYNRMTKDEFYSSIEFIKSHFVFIDIGDEAPTTTAVFKIIRDYSAKNKLDGVVIDPWNALEVPGVGGENKTYSIGRELNRARQIARRRNLCFNIVAHPAKMQRDFKSKQYPVPRPYDIDGSSNWYNMAYNCLSVYRYFKIDVIAVHIQKIKFKPHGKVGVIFLKYDKTTGRFSEWYGDPEEEEKAQTTMHF